MASFVSDGQAKKRSTERCSGRHRLDRAGVARQDDSGRPGHEPPDLITLVSLLAELDDRHHRDRLCRIEASRGGRLQLIGDPAHAVDAAGEAAGEIALFGRTRVFRVLGAILLMRSTRLDVLMATNQGVEIPRDALAELLEESGLVDFGQGFQRKRLSFSIILHR